jgi:BCD family chlorophyll transporter-like MFS transporter
MTPNSKAIEFWKRMSTRWLPFADAASDDLPLGRLLRLAMFQLPIGMALVLIMGTLNRVMIVELGVPTWLVAAMISLPILFAPLRMLIGHRSDTHVSVFGWRRSPYMWLGTMLQFGGYVILPPSLLLLSGSGFVSAEAGALTGKAGAALAFALIGFGIHYTQTAGLALMSDLLPDTKRPRAFALFYLFQLCGMIVSAFAFSWLLRDFTSELLIRVLHGAGVVALVINLIAIWQQEPRDAERAAHVSNAPKVRFADQLGQLMGEAHMRRLLIGIGLGTMAFSMQDVLLEPYGGEVLGLSVPQTTMLSALMGIGTLAGFLLSIQTFSRGMHPCRLAVIGLLTGIPAFTAVLFAHPLDSVIMFQAGSMVIGLGAGLFVVGSLSAAMRSAAGHNTGLVAGAWGAIQATAAGVGIAAGGVLRDVVGGLAQADALGTALNGPATSYGSVYLIEIFLLFITLVAIGPLVRNAGNDGKRQEEQFGLAELPG